ncbi:hypothetical protein ACT4ZY_06890 [Acinetobacter baumannii]
MSVPVQTPSKEYIANGTTTAFPLEFNCDKAEYLIVTLNGEEAPVGSWTLANDTVTFNVAPLNGVVVNLERNTPFQRTTNYQLYDNSFRPSAVNKDFDLIWWKLQELGYRDQVIWLALVKEIADRIAGDDNLQNQINTIAEWLDNLQQNVNENTSDIAQLVTDLSKEIADRIKGDQILKDMFLSMIDEAINEGTINALAVTHVDSLEALEGVTNVWDGRTIYVKDLGNYRYDALTTSWVKAYQDADNVKDGAETQKQINDKNIRSFESIADLLTYTAKKHGQVVFVESTNSHYKYNNLDMSPISLSGWVLQHSSIISTKQIGINYGDITNLIQFAIDNDLQIEIEKDVTVTSTVFNQNNVFGRGVLHYNNNPPVENDYSYLAPRSLNPYPRPNQNRTGWYDNVESRGNFENGTGYGLMVNRKDVRPQISGFRNLAGMKNYTSSDIAGMYIDVAAQKHSTISNSTSYTATSITSPDIVEGINVKKGDFLRTGRDAAGNSNLQWRGWVTDIDYESNTIYTAWWLSENGNVGTPTNGIVCITPDTNSVWGQNTNVYLYNDDPAHKIIGYELGVFAETGKTFESINGYLAVNLNSTNKATSAFYTSGAWGAGLRTNADSAVYAEGASGLRWTHNSNGSAIYAQSPTIAGTLIQSVAGSTVRYSMDGYGKQSHNRLDYAIHSASTAHNGLNPSVVFGANASAAHTTTLSTTSMTAGTILEFRQLQGLDWSIVAGSNTYVLNTAGTIDYLKLLFDGTNFLKIFAAKSL